MLSISRRLRPRLTWWLVCLLAASVEVAYAWRRPRRNLRRLRAWSPGWTIDSISFGQLLLVVTGVAIVASALVLAPAFAESFFTLPTKRWLWSWADSMTQVIVALGLIGTTAALSRRRVGLIGWPVVLMAIVAFNTHSHWHATTQPRLDEVYWSGSAYYFNLASTRGIDHHPDWQLLPARENPPIAKYVLGAGYLVSGRPVTDLNRLGAFYLAYKMHPGAWGTGPARVKRQAVVDRMSTRVDSAAPRIELSLPATDLLIGRVIMAACGFLAAATLYLLGAFAFGPRAGMLASLMLLYHPIYLASCQDIGADAIALAFSTGAVLVLTKIVKSDDGGRRIAEGVVLGVLLALACGSKLNALIVVVLSACAWGVLLARRRPALAGMTVGLMVFPVLFIAANPALYPDLLSGLRDLSEEHRRTLEIQSSFLDGRTRSFSERMPAIESMVGRSRFWFAIMTLCATSCVIKGVLERRGTWLVVAGWWWVALAAIVAWMPFAWPRYAVPLVPPGVLLLAATVDRCAIMLRRSAARSRRRLLHNTPALARIRGRGAFEFPAI